MSSSSLQRLEMISSHRLASALLPSHRYTSTVSATATSQHSTRPYWHFRHCTTRHTLSARELKTISKGAYLQLVIDSSSGRWNSKQAWSRWIELIWTVNKRRSRRFMLMGETGAGSLNFYVFECIDLFVLSRKRSPLSEGRHMKHGERGCSLDS